MIAFKLHYFFVCKTTGVARLVFSMSLDNIEKHHEKDCATVEHAEAYLSSTKRTWLLNCIEKFVAHKKNIWQNGSHPEQMNNCRICYDTYSNFFDQPLKKICERILKGQKYYEAILPNQNNDSYESSQANLNMIINFCKEETK